MPRLSRRGVTLPELLVALVVGTTVVAAATLLLRTQLRQASRLADRLRAAQAVRDAGHLVGTELRGIRPVVDSAMGVVGVTDGQLDAWMLRGTAVTCGRDPSGDALVVAPGTAHPWAADWPAAPRPGDRAAWPVAADPHDPGGDRWASAALHTAPVTATCPPPFDALIARRLHGVPGAVAGTPVRLLRRVRLQLHRGADGEWSLGVAEWSGARWSVPQPAVAPLAAVGDAPGLRFTALDAHGAPIPSLADALPLPALAIEVRAAGRNGRPRDSLLWRMPVGQP